MLIIYLLHSYPENIYKKRKSTFIQEIRLLRLISLQSHHYADVPSEANHGKSSPSVA